MRSILFSFFVLMSINVFSGIGYVSNINDSGAGSLRDAIANANNGDTIRFNTSLIAGGSDTIKLSSVISFQKNLTIEGLYNTTDTLFISGDNTTQIFSVDLSLLPASKLVFDGLSLVKAKNGNGAVLNYIGDTLIVKNCLVKDNSTLTRNAGFEIDGHYVYLSHSSFINNVSGSDAGAIDCETSGGEVNIINSIFSGNVGNSGAILIRSTGVPESSSNPIVNIKSCSFDYNQSTDLYAGGGLTITGVGVVEVEIDSSSFDNNISLAHGGALYVLNGGSSLNSWNLVDISNSSFNNNEAAYGGAVEISAKARNFVEIDNSNFIENHSDEAGALYVNNNDWQYADSSSLKITNCNFIKNYADYYAGAIATSFQDSTSILEIINTLLDSNYLTGLTSLGGAIGTSARLQLTNSIFKDNSAQNRGGAIYSEESKFLGITNTIFEGNNSISSHGGAIYANIQNLLEVNIYRSRFNNNKTGTSGNGGAIYLYGDSMNINIDTSQFNYNTAKSGGAIYADAYLYQLNVDIDSVSFIGDSSTQKGGALYLRNHSLTPLELNINESYFSDNKSAKGAAISIEESEVLLTIDSTRVENNSCGSASRGIIDVDMTGFNDYTQEEIITINYSEINNNNGVGIYLKGYNTAGECNGEVYINKTTLSDNTNGGIYNDQLSTVDVAVSRVETKESTLANNGNMVSGYGAIHVSGLEAGANTGGRSYVISENSTFYKNKTPNNGSAIYMYADLSYQCFNTIQSSVFSYNSGKNIYRYNTSTPSINTSNGYNIFSETVVGGSIASDMLGVDSITLDLGPLQNNGGFTKTLMPSTTSVAVDAGNPLDLSDAQNGPINNGRRDVGAAEYRMCYVYTNLIDSLCARDSIQFGGVYIKSSGVYYDTISTASCDSVITLTVMNDTTCYVPVADSCSDIFISEYIEGSSFNKAIELYNASSTSINLSAYKLKKYTNGSSVASDITLSGTIPAYSTYVIAHTSANLTILGLANQTSGSLNFTGNDAIALTKNDTLLDLIGVIGQDPGAQWGSGTMDHTLVRKSSIVGGIKQNPTSFDPITEWDIYSMDETGYLGSHANTCGNTTSINKNDLSKEFNFYPNPSTGMIQVFYNGKQNVILYSSEGALVQKITASGQLDLSHLSPGVYYFVITFDNQIVNKKLVITNK